MKKMNTNEMSKYQAGAKVYSCPFGNDYSGTSYWAVYGHALVHGLKVGYFTPAIKLILKGFGF